MENLNSFELREKVKKVLNTSDRENGKLIQAIIAAYVPGKENIVLSEEDYAALRPFDLKGYQPFILDKDDNIFVLWISDYMAEHLNKAD